jgi:predicted nucleic acid-binding protein
MPLRAVMDTNVLYAAFRSRLGASFEVFRRLRLGEWTVMVSNHLVHEYEEILKAKNQELSLSPEDADEILNANHWGNWISEIARRRGELSPVPNHQRPSNPRFPRNWMMKGKQIL